MDSLTFRVLVVEVPAGGPQGELTFRGHACEVPLADYPDLAAVIARYAADWSRRRLDEVALDEAALDETALHMRMHAPTAELPPPVGEAPTLEPLPDDLPWPRRNDGPDDEERD